MHAFSEFFQVTKDRKVGLGTLGDWFSLFLPKNVDWDVLLGILEDIVHTKDSCLVFRIFLDLTMITRLNVNILLRLTLLPHP